MATDNDGYHRRLLGADSITKTQQWLSREHGYRKVREPFPGEVRGEIWALPGSDDVLWPPRSVFFSVGPRAGVVSARADSLVWEAPTFVCVLCAIKDERYLKRYGPKPCGYEWCRCSCGRTADGYCGTDGA